MHSGATCFSVCTTLIPNPMEQKGWHRLAAGHMGKHQATLLDNPNVTLQNTSTRDLAILLLDSAGSSDLQHLLRSHWQSVVQLPDLLNQRWQSLAEFYTDRSSFTGQGRGSHHRQGNRSCRDRTVGTLAQKAELAALTEPWHDPRERNVSIHTDPKYPFQAIHAPGAIWKERILTLRE